MKLFVYLGVLLAVLLGLIAVGLSIYLSAPAEFTELPSENAMIAREIRNEIYQRFFEIFITITVVISAIAAILGVGAYSLIRERLEKQIHEAMTDRIKVAQARTLSIAFNEFAFSFYRQYEPLLQKFLSREIDDTSPIAKECLNLIGVTKDLAGHGLDVYEDLDHENRKDFISTPSGQRALVNILNQIVYANTAEVLVSNIRKSDEILHELDAHATLMYDLAVGRKLAEDDYNWWEAVETVGFFRLTMGKKSGNQNLERSGRTIVLSLANEQPPKRYLKRLPRDIVETVRSEYTDNGFDLPI